ncbi:MAG: serine--tRNA ligase [Methyloceanibacter sp.]|uniref:serine--tRNA ligase n=1 Tax=Methyloceanibacter sp. TaxID=1965321 RepID=UPI003D9B855F
MLDIKWIRENPEAFVTGLTDRGFDDPQDTLTQILKLDEQRRETIQKLQAAQARRNTISKEIGQAKAGGNDDWAETLKEEVAQLKTAIQEGEDQEREVEKAFQDLLAAIPNLPSSDVPVGPDADSNEVMREVGKKPKFAFEPKQHFELGEALGLMDFETAAKLSGARFVVLKGALARLERALAQFMLDSHTTEHGYTEINPPLLVRSEAMFGTAQLPKFGDDQFRTRKSDDINYEPFARELMETGWEAFEKKYQRQIRKYPNVLELATMMAAIRQATEKGDPHLPEYYLVVARALSEERRIAELDRWLIPTAEVPLTNLVREEIVEEAKLPLRVTAWTPCFRAEAGAAGKDTRGMIRQHQFTKVELVSITTPEQSANEHERMTATAEEVLKRLEIPYRVVTLSTGDMGFAARKTYDLEVWLPGQGDYREISSCSNCGDFQARRMNARYKAKGAKDTRFVHTLNGSGVAVGRALIAVLENYQEEDGSIRIPAALVPYMGGLSKIEAPK